MSQNVLSRIRKLTDFISRLERYTLVVIVTFMVIAAFGQVMLRNLFNVAIEGGDIVLRHLVLWIGFIGASLATREDKHITIDILARIANAHVKKVARLATLLFSLLVCSVLAGAGYLFVSSEFRYGTLLFGSVKAWYFELIIPLGFGLISLKFLGRFLETLLADEKARSA